MVWRPFVPALLGVLVLCTAPAAAAKPDPKTLAPGETGLFRVSGLPAQSPFTLRLQPADELDFLAHVATATGVTDAAGRAKVELKLPQTYQACALGTAPPVCETHPVFPGLVLEAAACSDPVAGPPGGVVTSSTVCTGGARTRVDGRAAFAPRRPAALKGVRWQGWGEAVARGRARGARRVRASHLVDCGGRLHYSRLTVGRRIRKNLAPCGSSAGAQVFPGARVAGASS